MVVKVGIIEVAPTAVTPVALRAPFVTAVGDKEK